MRRIAVPLTVVLTLTCASRVVAAEGPAFDCSKAEGTVEKLICGDDGLAALDRKLDKVYGTALAQARDDMPQHLRAEQRGWIKGRNDCWKAQGPDSPAFLTASWQAATVRECVEGTYKLRISELQALWGLVPSDGPFAYTCGDNMANEVMVTFFQTDPPTARLERGDRTVTAWLVPAGDGRTYEGQNVSFATEGKGARVMWLDETLHCRAVAP